MLFTINKIATLSILTAGFMATCLSAQAAGEKANLTVTASVTDNTCILKQPVGPLDLGVFPARAFNGKIGTEVGSKSFDLELIECGSAVSDASVTVEGTADADNKKAFKNNTSKGAEGVAIVIKGGSAAAAIDPKAVAKYKLTKAPTQKLAFSANLISTKDVVTAGAISVPITFTVDYK